MRKSATLMVALAVAPAVQADDRSELIRLEQAWVAASSSGDQATLQRLLHPDYVDITPQGIVRRKADVVSAAPLPKGTTQNLSELDVRTFGNIGVVTGMNRVSPPGHADLEVVFTDVYLLENGVWRAISSHHTFRRPRQAP